MGPYIPKLLYEKKSVSDFLILSSGRGYVLMAATCSSD